MLKNFMFAFNIMYIVYEYNWILWKWNSDLGSNFQWYTKINYNYSKSLDGS